ncbi:MAG: hemolysin family protein [Oscillospiraceae bacterium]|nr:hemolysin family protein [Oscillospiraceae bacterium]
MDDSIWQIIVIFICILLSAFFSSVETAFSFVNVIRLQSYAEDGNKKAKTALYISNNFDKALTTILICNNIVNLGCSALATVFCFRLFGEIGPAVATGATTLLVLTFGEIIPKCLAKEHCEVYSLHTAGILRFLMIVLTPIVFLFIKLKELAIKVAGNKNEQPSVTEDELKQIVENIEGEGVLEEDESEMVQSVLDFDDKTVLEVLTPRVDMTAIDIMESPEKLKHIIIESRYSRIPVYKDTIDHIIGILHTRDYLEDLANGVEPNIGKLIQTPYFVFNNQKLSKILSDFKRKRLHIAVVTDEYGGTLGIVTMEDLLEEIVGDIWDEDEEIENDFTKISDTQYIVSGDMPLENLFEIAQIDPDDVETDSVTVGGFVLEHFQTIPRRKAKFVFENIKFVVQQVNSQRIIAVDVFIEPKEEKED